MTNFLLLIVIVLLVFILKQLSKLSIYLPKPPKLDYDDIYGKHDPLFNTALKIVNENKSASASLLQRRLEIGYARAARLLDQLEEKGYVGPAIGSKPRKVLKNK